MKIQKKDMWLFIAQVAVWTVVLFALPLATFLSTQDVTATRTSFYGSVGCLFHQFLPAGPIPLL